MEQVIFKGCIVLLQKTKNSWQQVFRIGTRLLNSLVMQFANGVLQHVLINHIILASVLCLVPDKITRGLLHVNDGLSSNLKTVINSHSKVCYPLGFCISHKVHCFVLSQWQNMTMATFSCTSMYSLLCN